MIGLLPASLSAASEGVWNVYGLFVGVMVPDVLRNSGGGFEGVSAGVVEAGTMKGKLGLLSGEGVVAGAVVLSAATGAASPKMNGEEARLGSTGVGNVVEVMPNGKALLGGSTVAVVDVGKLNLNPAVLVAEAGADCFASLNWSPSFDNGILIEGILVGGVAVEAGAASFTGDPLSISSSRVGGGVRVCSRVICAGVGCGLGAAVGAVSTILGAGAERVIGAV